MSLCLHKRVVGPPLFSFSSTVVPVRGRLPRSLRRKERLESKTTKNQTPNVSRSETEEEVHGKGRRETQRGDVRRVFL